MHFSGRKTHFFEKFILYKNVQCPKIQFKNILLSQKKLIFFTILKEEAATTIIVDHRSHVWGECDPCGGRGRTSGVEIIARLPINQLDPGPAPAPASPHREGYIGSKFSSAMMTKTLGWWNTHFTYSNTGARPSRSLLCRGEMCFCCELSVSPPQQTCKRCLTLLDFHWPAVTKLSIGKIFPVLILNGGDNWF